MTNLFYHLEHKHPKLYSELCKVIPEKPEEDEDALSSLGTNEVCKGNAGKLIEVEQDFS